MIPTLGTTCLILILPIALYSGGMLWLGERYAHAAVRRSGWLAAAVVIGLYTVACVLLLSGFVGDHFEIDYVARHSHRGLPLFYKLAGLWAGLDGSLLLWAWLLAVMLGICLYQTERAEPRHTPYVNLAGLFILAFFGVMMLFAANPFATSVSYPFDGQGLNPLLQAPEMVIHPPSLYMGYVSASIPFALLVAGLATRHMDAAWLQRTRGWLLFSWFFLSVGNLLGMHWAYVELGWGGFWAWDPVENAAIMPWFTASALLHSILVEERRGMLRAWNAVLILLTFLLTILGTFLTRSGVVQSVHAFSNSTIGAYFAVFLAVLALGGAGLILWRRTALQGRNDLESLVSKEGAFLLNNILLTMGAFTILWGTMLPTFAEALLGERFMVGPPFFNQMLAPFGCGLLVLAGFGPVLAWRRAAPGELWRALRWPLLLAIVAMSLGWMAGLRHWFAIAALGGIGFTLWVTLAQFGQGIWRLHRQEVVPMWRAPGELLRRAPRRYGGFIIHVAMLSMCAAFAGALYHTETNVHLRQDERVQVGGYDITFEGLRYRRDAERGMEAVAGQLRVERGGRVRATLFPARQFFVRSEQPTTEAAIYRSWRHDVYTVLGGFNVEERTAEFKLMINPLVNCLWAGGLLLILGVIVMIWPWQRPQSLATAVLAVLVLAGTMGFAPRVSAAAPLSEDALEHVTTDAAKKMVCLCPTCPRINLRECECDFAAQRREELRAFVRQGMNADQAVQAMVARYGTDILAMPPVRGWRRLLLWGPFLLVGLVILIVGRVAYLWTQRTRRASAPGACP